MTDFATALKAEVTRLARKEVRAQIEPLRQSLVAYRTQVSSLRAEISSLQKQLKNASKTQKNAGAANKANEAKSRQRFTAKGLLTMRSKLGLSREKFGLLIEASGQAIKNWEEGAATPREKYQQKIFALRGVGKKTVTEKLAQLEQPE